MMMYLFPNLGVLRFQHTQQLTIVTTMQTSHCKFHANLLSKKKTGCHQNSSTFINSLNHQPHSTISHTRTTRRSFASNTNINTTSNDKVPFKQTIFDPLITASPQDLEKQLRVDLAATYRLASMPKFGNWVEACVSADSCNHISCALPSGDKFLIAPAGIDWNSVKASNLICVDSKSGKTIDGKGDVPSTAFYMHSTLHQKRPVDAKVIIHLHSPYLTGLSIVHAGRSTTSYGRLDMIHQNSTRFEGKVSHEFPFQGLPTTEQEGERIAKALGDKLALLMGNHGSLVIGKTIALAFSNMYYLENAAKHQTLAMQTGLRFRKIDEQVAQKAFKVVSGTNVESYYAHVEFEMYKRLLDKEAPDYKD